MPESSRPHGLTVDKPISAWTEQLGIDYRALFTDLGKATLSGVVGFTTGATASIVTSIKSVIDSCSAFGDSSMSIIEVQDEPGQVAWLLVHNALLRAFGELIGEHAELFRLQNRDAEELPDPGTLAESLDFTLQKEAVLIDASFFEQPKSLTVLNSFQALLLM